MGFESRVLNTVKEIAPYADAHFANNELFVEGVGMPVAMDIGEALEEYVTVPITVRYDQGTMRFRFLYE